MNTTRNNIDIFILARLDSKRLPKKQLRKIGNETLLKILVNRLRKSKKIRNVVVCTTNKKTDEPLISFLKKEKILYFRGSEKDVLKRLLGAAKKFSTDIIIDVEGDKIYTDSKLVDLIVKQFLDSNLIPLRGDIQNFQKEAYNVDTKIIRLDPIMIASDLKQTNNEIQQSYNSINSAFDKSFSEYNNQEYIISQSLFSSSWKSSISSSLVGITKLKLDIDERVKDHNEAIKNLQELINQIK